MQLDGNAVAGPLADLFGEDMTLAVGRCAGCQRDAALAEASAFVMPMGIVIRCAACQWVQAVLVSTPRERIINLSGLSHLRVAKASGDISSTESAARGSLQ